MIIVDDIIQGSSQWHELRIGNPGGSSMNRIVTTRGEASKSQPKYMDDLIDEIILKRKLEGFSTWRMREGIEKEQDSVDAYELKHGVEVSKVGLVYKNERRLFHYSPDGLIFEREHVFETKDALPHIQKQRLDHGKLPTEHFVQCQTGLYVTDWGKLIFQSYCENMPTLTIEVEPDYEFLEKLDRELHMFIARMQLRLKEYRKYKGD